MLSAWHELKTLALPATDTTTAVEREEFERQRSAA
jgi:hypothetical protein